MTRGYSKTLFHLLLYFLLTVLIIGGCGPFRTEIYRGETYHLYTKGAAAYKKGDFDGAFTIFQRTTEKDPAYARAYAGMGNIALIREDFAAAEQYYRRAIEIEPELESSLIKYLLLAVKQNQREPILKCGADLKTVYTLLSKGKRAAIEKLLSCDMPLALLARDTISLTMTELAGLEKMIVTHARTGRGSARFRLLLGYFLFHSSQNDRLAAEVLEEAVKKAGTEDQQEAWMMLGRLYERMGLRDQALDAFHRSIRAGQPLFNVAPYLAGIYRVPIEDITNEYDPFGADMDRDRGNSPPAGAAASTPAATMKSEERNVIPSGSGSLTGTAEDAVYHNEPLPKNGDSSEE